MFSPVSDIILSQNRFRHSPLSDYRAPISVSVPASFIDNLRNIAQPLSFSKPHPKASLHLIPTSAVEGRLCFKAQRRFCEVAWRREDVSEGKWINSGRALPEAETLLLIVQRNCQSIDKLTHQNLKEAPFTP